MASREGVLSRITSYSDIIFALALVVILVMFIIPLPTFVLDLLLTINITFALTVLLVSIYILEPLDFAVFPSLLLFATLFRLALNVSTTRLILGQAFAGDVIEAFGSFVVAGNYVVGFVIFVIIVVIQFVVITKGAERVAEVAARFTLDAMPGKQMSIDADLNTGLITEDEAREQRQKIRQEADFYGAMDGASKFVKGDAIAGIVITLVNILGGLVIGILQQQMSATEALQTYTLLTVGDGLVSQIPALLISAAAGMVVTRAASESSLGSDLSSQMLSQPKTLLIVSGILFIFSFVSGLPTIPFMVLGIVSGLFGYLLWDRKQEVDEEQTEAEEERPTTPEEERAAFDNLLQVDPLEVEVGYNLIPLVVPEQGGDFLERVTMIRKQLAIELGLIIPTVRVLDNMQLDPDTYRIKLRGTEVSSFQIMPNHYLAMDMGVSDAPISGQETVEPAFGLPALWISEEQKEEAEMAGYTVVDGPSIMATHLTEVIKKRAHELLGRQEVKDLIDNLRDNYSAVVDELLPELMTLGEIQKVLQNLLRESVSIRDLVTILETLADQARSTRDPAILTEYARQALSRQITFQLKPEEGPLEVITLDPALEEELSQSLEQTEKGSYLALDPDRARSILKQLKTVLESRPGSGQPIVLTAPIIRYHFKELTAGSVPELTVISYRELVPDVDIEAVGVVSA